MDNDGNCYLRDRRCPECGRTFLITVQNDEWVYRDQQTLLCSWRCMRKREKQREEAEAQARMTAKRLRAMKMSPRQKQAMVRRLVLRGMTNKEISLETGLSAQLVIYYRRKIEEDSW